MKDKLEKSFYSFQNKRSLLDVFENLIEKIKNDELILLDHFQNPQNKNLRVTTDSLLQK